MMPELLTQPIVVRTGWTLLHVLWQGTLVAGALAVLLWLLRNRSANARYAACLAALLLLVAGPVVTWFALPGSAPSTANSVNAPAASPSAVAALPMVAEAPTVTTELSAPSWPNRFQRMMQPALPWVVAGWSLGVVLLSARLLGGWLRVQRLRRSGTAVSSRWQRRAEVLAGRMGLTRAARLVQSAHVNGPMVVGWLRPVVLLPAGLLTGLPPEQIEAILAHELAHIRRHDYLVNLLQAGAETLLFYHPAVWWVSRRLRTEREFCCDDLATRACADRLVYARARCGALAPRSPYRRATARS